MEDDPDWNKTPSRVNENAHNSLFTTTSILPTIRVKVKTPTERSVLSSQLRSAWKAVYFQVPNATYSGVPASGTNSFNVVYEQNATTASADEWVSKTYGEQDYASSDDIDDILGRELGDIGRRRLQRELGNTVFLRAIFFHKTSSSSLVIEFGLIAFVEHFAFDGTGTYNLLSKVLENAVNGVDLSNSIKVRPEPPFFDYLDKDIVQGEHLVRLAKITDNFMSQFVSSLAGIEAPLLTSLCHIA